MSPTQFVQALLQGGVAPDQVAAITLYRQQIKLLQHTLEATGIDGVEIITADKSQGRDKDCVVVSMVRSNDRGSVRYDIDSWSVTQLSIADRFGKPLLQVGELLRDWRRINVAFTRAKAKLVIVGSRSTLAADPLLGRFLALIAASAWVVDLPPNVRSQHRQLSVLRKVKAVPDDQPAPTVNLDTPLAPTTPPSARQKRPSIKEEPVDTTERDENVVGLTPTKSRVPKKARLSEEAILKGRPLLRDVLNEYL